MNEKEQVNEGYVIIESVTVGNARRRASTIAFIRRMAGPSGNSPRIFRVPRRPAGRR